MIQNMTQKLMVEFLDNAAQRADDAGSDPATSKQCWFLARLILQSTEAGAVDAFTECGLILTKRSASSWIASFLKDEQKKSA